MLRGVPLTWRNTVCGCCSVMKCSLSQSAARWRTTRRDKYQRKLRYLPGNNKGKETKDCQCVTWISMSCFPYIESYLSDRAPNLPLTRYQSTDNKLGLLPFMAVTVRDITVRGGVGTQFLRCRHWYKFELGATETCLHTVRSLIAMAVIGAMCWDNCRT